MRIEKVFWRFAIACGVILLLAPLTPRTIWIASGPNPYNLSKVTEGIGWLGGAFLLGAMVLVALVGGAWVRSHVVLASIGVGIAFVAFGATVIGMGLHWVDLMNQNTSVHPEGEWIYQPAPAVAFLVGIAMFGTIASLLLLGTWLRPGEKERQTA